MRPRVLSIAVILLSALATVGFQQGRPTRQANDDQVTMLGLMRTINTIEVSDHFGSGSYQSWPELMERHSKDLNGWLVQNGLTRTSFAGLPEVLPGWKLRLSISADGHSYSVLLEDTGDKRGFAYISDERGIIREAKYTD